MCLNSFTHRFGRRRCVRVVAATIFVFWISSFSFIASWGMSSKPTQISKGERILSIQVNLGEEGDYDSIFDESLEAGNETQVLSQDWNELETTPGKFEPSQNFLAIANVYYPARHIPLHLTIRPIHTNRKVVPSDLVNTPLDDPLTILRFKALLDWISRQIPRIDFVSLAIGSEVDMFMWGRSDRWTEWINFYAAVAPYARQKFPDTLISCETTYRAFLGADLENVRALHEHSDVIGVSYYPMRHKLGGVKSPEVVHTDFRTVVEAIPQKPIIYYQIGYPSSPALKSSLTQQSNFITEAFRAWDTDARRILMLNFQWMHEAPNFGVDQYVEYYQYDTPNFREFLGSLGLQSWSGDPKPAWNTLKEESKARGFGR